MSFLSKAFKGITKVFTAPAEWITDAVGSVAGSVINGVFNNDAIDKTNEANRDLWREQAAYNTPKNQMLRYQAAGLNPNLVYSQGNPGNMASAPTMQPRHLDLNPMKDFVLSATRKNLVEQNKNLQSQNSLLRSQKSVADANARRINYETDWLKKHGTSSFDASYLRGIKSLSDYFQPIADTVGAAVGTAVGSLRSQPRLVPTGDDWRSRRKRLTSWRVSDLRW